MFNYPLARNASKLKSIGARALFAAFAFIICFAAAQSINAATFVVNTTNDTQDAIAGNGTCADAVGACSLRAAITEANAFAGADTITLPAGTYTETLAGASENANAGGDFDITSDITINGAGAASTIVQANAAAGVATERVFHLRAVATTASLTVVLDGMTIQNGRNAINAFGGGIRIDQGTNHNVTISNSTVTNNLNDSSGGGLSISGTVTPTVTITNSTFSNNRAGSAASGTSASGGGIQVNVVATVNITNTTITGNTATTGLTTIGPTGGGISISGGTTTITNSTISNNTASLAVSDSANSTFSGGVHLTGGTANITGTTISGNSSTATGGTGFGFAGGIYNQQATLNLTNSTVTGNTASSFHGGIRALSQTILTTTNITNSTISNNTAAGEGGGVVNFAVGAANSIVNITSSAIVSNSGGSGSGGGVVNISNSTGLATVTLNNSTVGGNSAANGAGINNAGANSAINLKYSTVASNTATTSGGGLFQDATGTTNLLSSIVANNTAPTGPDIAGTITSQNYNHVENTAGGTFAAMANDVTGTDPALGALALNGGTTLNYAPQAGSPVLDTIPNGTNGCGAAPFNVDQRNMLRPTDSNNDAVAACEKGSVESLAPTAATVSISGTVSTPQTFGLTNALVTLTDQQGNTRTVITGKGGRFTFRNVAAGETYIISVSSKRYTYAPQIVSPNENISEIIFTAQ